MGNHHWNQFSLTPVKGVNAIYAQVAFNATGTPTLVAWNPSTRTYAAAPTGGTQGVLSVSRTGTGAYTITLQDTYQRLIACNVTLIGSAAALAPIWQVKVASNPNAAAATTAQALGTSANAVQIQFYASQNSAADPAATELGIIEIKVQNSAAF